VESCLLTYITYDAVLSCVREESVEAALVLLCLAAVRGVSVKPLQTPRYSKVTPSTLTDPQARLETAKHP
jgi:hypothetical protein